MYHVSVSITLKSCEQYGTEKYIDRLREIGAVRVLLFVGSYETDADKRKEQMRPLKNTFPFFSRRVLKRAYDCGRLWCRETAGFIKHVLYLIRFVSMTEQINDHDTQNGNQD